MERGVIDLNLLFGGEGALNLDLEQEIHGK